MQLEEKAKIMDEAEINQVLTRLAAEIVELSNESPTVFLGIERRGVPIAERLYSKACNLESVNGSVGVLDISFYGDDLSLLAPQPIVKNMNLPVDDISKVNIILIDDVIYSGQTISTALNAILAVGRPKRIQLAVLIDRGHRTLPIHADYIGKFVPTRKSEIIKVMLKEVDDVEQVLIVEDVSSNKTSEE